VQRPSHCRLPLLRSSQSHHSAVVVVSCHGAYDCFITSWLLRRVVFAIIAELMAFCSVVVNASLFTPSFQSSWTFCSVVVVVFDVRWTFVRLMFVRSMFVRLSFDFHLFDVCLMFIQCPFGFHLTSVRRSFDVYSISVRHHPSGPFYPLTSVHKHPSINVHSSLFIPADTPYSSNRMLC